MRFLYLYNQTFQKLSGSYYQKSVSFLANDIIKWNHFRLIPYIFPDQERVKNKIICNTNFLIGYEKKIKIKRSIDSTGSLQPP